jgi:hypothetical protein
MSVRSFFLVVLFTFLGAAGTKSYSQTLTVGLPPGPVDFGSGDEVEVSLSLSGTSGLDNSGSCTYQVTGSGYPSTTFQLSNGKASYTLSANALPVGNITISCIVDIAAGGIPVTGSNILVVSGESACSATNPTESQGDPSGPLTGGLFTITYTVDATIGPPPSSRGTPATPDGTGTEIDTGYFDCDGDEITENEQMYPSISDMSETSVTETEVQYGWNITNYTLLPDDQCTCGILQNYEDYDPDESSPTNALYTGRCN